MQAVEVSGKFFRWNSVQKVMVAVTWLRNHFITSHLSYPILQAAKEQAWSKDNEYFWIPRQFCSTIYLLQFISFYRSWVLTQFYRFLSSTIFDSLHLAILNLNVLGNVRFMSYLGFSVTLHDLILHHLNQPLPETPYAIISILFLVLFHSVPVQNVWTCDTMLCSLMQWDRIG